MTNGMDAFSRLDQLRSTSRLEADPDQEGWLVSYADLITLLFIFFSTMLSISSVSKTKFELLTHEFNQESLSSLTELKKQLDAEVTKENLRSDILTEMTDEGLQIQFNERVLFPLGEAGISPEGNQILKKFSRILSEIESRFQLTVEGHTDNRPIRTAAFPSNWALSATRSVNVLHFLAANGVEEKQMMVRAYANTRPLSNKTSNTNSDSEARNRRVTLLVF